jgi:hypothetical protein
MEYTTRFVGNVLIIDKPKLNGVEVRTAGEVEGEKNDL